MHRATGWNLRVVDGHIAHELAMASMLAADVDLIIDAGDLFHWSHPKARDIAVALRVDDMRVDAGIPLLAQSGNHDAGPGNETSAIAVVHRPSLLAYAVYPDLMRTEESSVGPHPGLYEVHQPFEDLPLLIHMVNHYGLDTKRLAERGITIDPQPIEGFTNLFTSHGIFMADDRLYKAAERHGDERLIPAEWARRGFDAYPLGDFHTRGPIPGFGDADRGQVWYAGSSVQRGFSDAAGARGWLMIELNDTGTVSITEQDVWQRPQADFDPIDASEMTIPALHAAVTDRLSAQEWWDEESAELTGDGGWVLRQRITGTTSAQRSALRAVSADWSAAAGNAAWWGFVFDGTASGPEVMAGTGTRRAITSHITDFNVALTDRLGTGKTGTLVRGLRDDERDDVLTAARGYLSRVDADIHAAATSSA